MTTSIVLHLISGIIGYFSGNKKIKDQQSKVDYSFGSTEAQQARALLMEKKYHELELLILNLKPEILTVTADYLALSLKTTVFNEWLESSKNKDVARLCLGVHYLHQAWISRSHARGNQVSEEQANAFFEYQDLSMEQFLDVSPDFKWITEVRSRLIRLNMGMGDFDMVHDCFESVISTDSKLLWPYVHYCEAIEPKWGSELTTVTEFMKRIPRVAIIQYVIELKLILDSLKMDENYFGGTMDELRKKAKTTVEKIDAEITLTPLNSINKYMVYGYIQVIAGLIKNKKLSQKYFDMVAGNYMLYPYGIKQV